MPNSEAYTNFIKSLNRGEFDNDLADMLFFLQERKKNIAPKAWEFQVGERVVLNENVNPKYLHGANATIRKINRTKVVIDLDHPQGRFHKGITTPTSMLSKA